MLIQSSTFCKKCNTFFIALMLPGTEYCPSFSIRYSFTQLFGKFLFFPLTSFENLLILLNKSIAFAIPKDRAKCFFPNPNCSFGYLWFINLESEVVPTEVAAVSVLVSSPSIHTGWALIPLCICKIIFFQKIYDAFRRYY